MTAIGHSSMNGESNCANSTIATVTCCVAAVAATDVVAALGVAGGSVGNMLTLLPGKQVFAAFFRLPRASS